MSSDKMEFDATYVLEETAITKAASIEELAESALRYGVVADSEEISSTDGLADITSCLTPGTD